MLILYCNTNKYYYMSEQLNYYRIKMNWLNEMEDSSLSKVTTEDLVYVSSYTEAERIAYCLIEDQQRTRFSNDISFEIVKTKISEILYNDSLKQDGDMIGGLLYNYVDPNEGDGVGIYSVKIMIITIDEKTAKEKRSYETIYTPATSNVDAANRIKNHLLITDYTIRDVKFDKAESVLWPTEVFQAKMNSLG